MRSILTTICLVGALALSACGGGGGPGDTCDPNEQGKDCDSEVCLVGVQCSSGKMLNACAGDNCSGTGICAGGEQCVPVTGTNLAFCVPTDICK